AATPPAFGGAGSRRATKRWTRTRCGPRTGELAPRGRRRDTNDGDGQRSAPQHDLPGEARERARGACLRVGQDAQELHPDSARRPGGGRSLAVRSNARSNHVPIQVKRNVKGREQPRPFIILHDAYTRRIYLNTFV